MSKEFSVVVRLLMLEKKSMPYEGAVPGTQLERVLGPDGPQWSLGLGRIGEPKEFFVADTIEECLDAAEKSYRPTAAAKVPTKIQEQKLEGYKLRYRIAVETLDQYRNMPKPKPRRLKELQARAELWAEKVSSYAAEIH